MRRLNTKHALTRFINVKLANIVKDRKLMDRMSAGDLLNFLNMQSHLWSGQDLDCMRYAFKKRLPELSSVVGSSESFLRGSLNTIANLNLGGDKFALDFALKVLFPEKKDSEDSSYLAGMALIENLADKKDSWFS